MRNDKRLRTFTAARLVLAGLLVALASPARADDETPALPAPSVVELFTSQGCSSCPPADAMLSRIALQPGVIALSMPVDYWDYLGWKDTLAQPAFTQRQKAYAHARGDARVYTPQIVVDGAAHAVGSDASDVGRAAREAQAHKGAMGVAVALAPDRARVDIGAASAGGPRQAIVYALRVARAKSVAIGRGENRNRTITYANVVRAMSRIGEWTGEAASFEVPASLRNSPDGDAIAVLVQTQDQARPGLILGAALR
ncbi:MAG: DUF1223 domain-containing protein [Rhizobiales bacterium]|nr:DUF1223 domain-containing protein [Hyphomicrobiales bacterium]